MTVVLARRYVTVKSKKNGGPGLYYSAFFDKNHPFSKLLMALAKEVNLKQQPDRNMLMNWSNGKKGVLLFAGYPLGLTIKEGDEVIHKFIRTHG